MTTFVIAYPRFGPAARAWVDELRAAFDPQSELVAPHVTLVFGTDRLSPTALAAHVRLTASSAHAFECHFREARAVPDADTASTYVFLVPEDGYDRIVELHDRLYEGALAADLRRDVSFVPHVTLARCDDALSARRLVTGLRVEEADLRGLIDRLVVVELRAGILETVEVVMLQAEPTDEELERLVAEAKKAPAG